MNRLERLVAEVMALLKAPTLEVTEAEWAEAVAGDASEPRVYEETSA